MDFNKLTIKSGEAVARAQELARQAGNPELTRDHLAAALLEQELPRTLLQRAGAEPGAILAETEARIRALPAVSGSNAQPQAGASFRKALDGAFEETRKLDDDFVSVEHLVLALYQSRQSDQCLRVLYCRVDQTLDSSVARQTRNHFLLEAAGNKVC